VTTQQPAHDPFAAPDSGWQPVSPRLSTVRRICVVIPLAVATVVAVLALLTASFPAWSALALAIGAIACAWAWLLIGRQVRAKTYALRKDDLLVSSGIMFKRLVVVPYGRMQLVDVRRGPIDRQFGLASVQLHTAAATTDASVPGLTPEVAAELRDRLAALGESRSAGL
jgi:uncharacterized protein